MSPARLLILVWMSSVSLIAAAEARLLLSWDDIHDSRDRTVKAECAALASFYSTLLRDMNHCTSPSDCVAIRIKNSYGCRMLVHKAFTDWVEQVYRWDGMIEHLCGERLQYPVCLRKATGVACVNGRCVTPDEAEAK